MVETAQLSRWRGDFGNAYIERNEVTPENHQKRQNVWQDILKKTSSSEVKSILEVGSNIGLNIRALKEVSKAELYAVEPNPKARQRILDDNVLDQHHVLDGSAFALPFDDASKDLVFTCGVLIHVHPDDLQKACNEIYRVSKKYILAIEIFSKKSEVIHYRGYDDMLFKRDYGLKWLEFYPNLKPIAQGFLWQPTTSIDDSVWWLFEK
jgi:pseudaminic acid biosynthesis-associated methylase